MPPAFNFFLNLFIIIYYNNETCSYILYMKGCYFNMDKSLAKNITDTSEILLSHAHKILEGISKDDLIAFTLGHGVKYDVLKQIEIAIDLVTKSEEIRMGIENYNKEINTTMDEGPRSVYVSEEDEKNSTKNDDSSDDMDEMEDDDIIVPSFEELVKEVDDLRERIGRLEIKVTYHVYSSSC